VSDDKLAAPIPSVTLAQFRGQPVRPKPPLDEATVESWKLPEDQRELVLQLVRYIHLAHDEFRDGALRLERARFEAEGSAESARHEAQRKSDELVAANERIAKLEAYVEKLGTVAPTLSALSAELTRLRTEAGA